MNKEQETGNWERILGESQLLFSAAIEVLVFKKFFAFKPLHFVTVLLDPSSNRLLRHDFPAHNAESAFEEGIVGVREFRFDEDGEAEFRSENGSKSVFHGQAVFVFLEAFFVKGLPNGDGESSRLNSLGRGAHQ